jgi:two-component system response regulator AtoC
LAPALLEALQNYSWPGNIRELENIMKRFVILQDKALLLRELRSGDRDLRSGDRDLRSGDRELRPADRDLRPTEPLANASTTRAEEHIALPGTTSVAATVVADEATPQPGPGDNATGGNGARAALTSATSSLAEVARLAMVEAERDLIVPTLRRVNWNRRKAAPLLGVSYKTLLNKIKEHGIVQG